MGNETAKKIYDYGIFDYGKSLDFAFSSPVGPRLAVEAAKCAGPGSPLLFSFRPIRPAEYYLKVSESDYAAAASQNFADVTQLVTQLGDFGGAQEKPESASPGSSSTSETAGEGIRTLDVQLGKLAFCH